MAADEKIYFSSSSKDIFPLYQTIEHLSCLLSKRKSSNKNWFYLATLQGQISFRPSYQKFINLATIKRKRGRPRRIELTDDFDVNLIQEFEKRVDLYDRNAPNFKDKSYLDELWDELSQVMGYDTNIVKDRMVQLRNRYHLEKKRMEALKVENPTRCVESKWALFDRLSFLSEHIPVRRSFRTLRCKRPYSDSEYAVKTEPDSDAESLDADQRGDYEYKPGRKEPVHHNRSNGKSTPPKPLRYLLPSKPLASRSAPPPPRHTRLPRQIYASRHAQAIYQRNQPPPQPINRSPQGSEKFLAFGQFLTSSLIELPEKDALLLVNQFTSELVQSYLSKDNQENENHKETPDEDPKQPEVTVNCNGHDNDIQFTE